MIESRYKIEYVFPDEEVKKTSPFRVLWYLLLIPLIGIIVAAITYNFSIKDISRDSLVFYEKVKVQIFNLGDLQKPKTLDKEVNQLVNTPIKKTTSKAIEKQNIPIKLEVPIASMDRYKIKISELTSKQASQLESIQKQIKENSTLSLRLNKLSEQFVLEQVKNLRLNSQLAEQEKDRSELEEQLNKLLEKTIAGSDNSFVKSSIIDSIEKKITPKKPKTEIKKETIIASETKTIESEDAVIVQDAGPVIAKDVVKTTELADKTQQSETDKIIQAMTTIAKETSSQTEQSALETKETPNESESKPESEVVVFLNKEDLSDAKDETNKTDKDVEETKADLTSVNSTLPSKKISKVTELAVTVKEQELGNTAVSDDVSKDNAPDNDPQQNDKTDTAAVNKTLSSVDAIIAAMQETQTNVADSNSQPTNTNQSLNPELEKDTKQQLVGQGKKTIDK